MIPGWLSKVLYVNAGLDAIIFMIPGKVAVIDLFKARLLEKLKRNESLDDTSNHLVDVGLNIGGFGFLMHAMVRFSAGHYGTELPCRMAIFSYLLELVQALVMVKKGHMAVADSVPAVGITSFMAFLTFFYGARTRASAA
mmetsp:Transcript_8358/g.10928  ORF Transcript_8358/g.10928 Transcript_8358/m.10928 type:complete len:140 (+) Transcript_8358:44-463(+)